jgi:hypothetical protein
MYSLRIKYKNNCHVNLDFSRILVLFYYVNVDFNLFVVLESSCSSPRSKRSRVLEVPSNPRLLVPYLDLSSDTSSFHDEDSRSSVISSDTTSSSSSLVRLFMLPLDYFV